MNIIKILFLNLVVASTLVVNARATDVKHLGNNTDTTSIIFSGKISDLKDASNLLGEASLHIYVSKLPFSYLDMTTAPHREFVVKYTEGETFTIRVPNAEKINYIYMAYGAPMNKPISNSVNWIDNIYIANGGDSIFCQLKANSRVFSGRGAEKFNLQQQLYGLRYIGPPSENQQMLDKNTFAESLKVRDFKCDSVFRLQMKVARRYKDSLDQSTINIMVANCIGTRYYGHLRYLTTLKDQYPIIVGSNFFKKIGTQAEGIESADLLQSPVYYTVILQKLNLEASQVGVIENTAMNESRFQKIYKLILERYSGGIRDKLITMLILGRQKDGFKSFQSIIEKFQDNKYKEVLIILMNLKKKGRDFSKYSLTNIDSKVTSLSEFNEKVVILDFWYTGCIACIKLNESLYPIYEMFKNNPKVKFVSVSIDRTMDIWKRGLNSGKYTHEAGMNLFTGGLESNHPIIKENMIVSYPQFYILKNGMIWDAFPPRPRGPKDAVAIEEFRMLIEKAIRE